MQDEEVEVRAYFPLGHSVHVLTLNMYSLVAHPWHVPEVSHDEHSVGQPKVYLDYKHNIIFFTVA